METAKTFTMYGVAGNSKGEWILLANLREWTATGSRSLGDKPTGDNYGKGNKGFQAGKAETARRNALIVRPSTLPMEG